MEMPRHREVKYLGQFYTVNEYRNSASTPKSYGQKSSFFSRNTEHFTNPLQGPD